MWRNPFATPREGHSQPPTKENKAAKVRCSSIKKERNLRGVTMGGAGRGGVLNSGSGLIMWSLWCAVRLWQGQGGQLWGRLPDEKEEHQVQTHTPLPHHSLGPAHVARPSMSTNMNHLPLTNAWLCVVCLTWQSFMEAVDAWRRGRRGDTESAPAPPSSSSHLPTPLSLPTPRLMSEAGTNTPRTAATPMSLPIARSNNDTADEGSSPVIKARRNVQEMADRIANQLYVFL